MEGGERGMKGVHKKGKGSMQGKDSIQEKGGIFSNYAYLYRELFRADRRNFRLLLLHLTGGVATACLGVYLPKLLVKLVTEGVSTTLLLASVIGFCWLLLLAKGSLCFTLQMKNQCLKLRHILEEKVLHQICATDYSNLEDPVYRGKIERAKELYQHWSRDVCECIYNSVNVMMDGLKFLILGGILVTLHPLVIALMLLCCLIQKWAGQRQIAWTKKNRIHWESLERKIDYISNITCDFDSAKDQRLYATDEWLLPKSRGYMEERSRWNRRELKQKLAAALISRGAFVLQQAAVYGFLIWGVLEGRITGDEFALYVAAAIQMSETLFSFGTEIGKLREMMLSIVDYRAVVEEGAGKEVPVKSLPPLSHAPSITLSRVSFSYPNAEKKALEEINLQIRAGERIAIVGSNGAGKTTLVKLLCGMYQPTQGQISLDGIPGANWERDAYYRMFSVAFQDFVVMPGTIGENVAGCQTQQLDRNRVRRCLEQAGLWEAVEKLPQGMDTPMPKAMFREGRNLSGGETQKLLLARAIYRDAPILILDEPTAALDAIAENDLYQSYGRLTENRTSIYISHRLASTRFCDRILMMEAGRILEEGSHDELMAKKGAYYRLFEIQSHYYQHDRSQEFTSQQDPSWEVSSYVSE